MIHEHFCNYENSLALKELGFIENTICGWDDFKILNAKLSSSTGRHTETYWHKRDTQIRAPLLSQGIQWILEQFNITIEIRQESFIPGWAYWLWDGSKFLGAEPGYETWNQCAQDAITKALQIIKDERTDIDK